MADATGFWQRLPPQGRFCFLILISNIVFLLISMGITAWSISDYDTFIKFFQQYEATGVDGFGSGSGSGDTLPIGSSILLPSYTLGDVPGLDSTTTSNSLGRSSTLDIDQISRTYTTFTSTFTTTRTSFSVDPAGYTLTSYITWTRSNGVPYMTFTNYFGGSRSAVTTFTSTGTRLARSTLAKREHIATTTTSISDRHEETHSPATVAEAEMKMTPPSPPQSMPTAAPIISTAAAMPLEQVMVMQNPTHHNFPEKKLLHLYRRQSLTGLNIQQYIDAAKVLLALNSVILVIIILQLILCVAYLVALFNAHQSEQAEENQKSKLQTYSKWFAVISACLCFLLLVFAIASTAYRRSKFGGTGAGNIALFIFFWIVSALLGFVLVASVFQLSKRKGESTTKSEPPPHKSEEGTASPAAVSHG